MSAMLDPFWIKSFEKTHRIRLSPEELETARTSQGEVELLIDGRRRYYRIPILNFPNDLITMDWDGRADVSASIWEADVA